MTKKLTVSAAAEHAGVSAYLVYLWCNEGRLAHYRMGGAGKRGKILIEVKDLDEFVAGLKVVAPPVPPPSAGKPVFKHLKL